MRRSTVRARLAAPLLSLALLATASACDPLLGSGAELDREADPDAAVFLTLKEPPQTFMEALYQGRVVRDAAGCLRLEETGDSHTVVWPHGTTLEGHDGGLRVRLADGRVAGRIGGNFKLGGGEVVELWEGVVTDEVRAEAEARCPGRYWLVGAVPE